MTADTNNPEPTLQDLADKIDKLTVEFDHRFNEVDQRFATLSQSLERSNDKFDTYQKATQWVVQLAFTLIASATITIILSTLFK
jgi:phosphotransacetylase